MYISKLDILYKYGCMLWPCIIILLSIYTMYIKISFHIHFIASPNLSLCIDLVKYYMHAVTGWAHRAFFAIVCTYVCMY